MRVDPALETKGKRDMRWRTGRTDGVNQGILKIGFRADGNERKDFVQENV